MSCGDSSRTATRRPCHVDLEIVPKAISRGVLDFCLPPGQQDGSANDFDVDPDVPVRDAARPAEELAEVVAVGDDVDLAKVEIGKQCLVARTSVRRGDVGLRAAFWSTNWGSESRGMVTGSPRFSQMAGDPSKPGVSQLVWDKEIFQVPGAMLVGEDASIQLYDATGLKSTSSRGDDAEVAFWDGTWTVVTTSPSPDWMDRDLKRSDIVADEKR